MAGKRLARYATVILLFLLLTGLGAAFYITARNVASRTASNNWTTVEGTVTTSKVAVSYDPEFGNIHYPEVTYQYAVEGVHYVGTEGSLPGDPEAVVAQYPARRRVTVFYNPDLPSQSVLVTGSDAIGPGELIFLCVSLPILAALTWLIVHVIRIPSTDVGQ